MKTLFTKDFTLVAVGQIISLFGNAILRFALPLYLLRTTGSAALFGLVTACSFLPMIILSFLGGVLADRMNKRNIMVVLDFITALLVLGLLLTLGRLPLVPLLMVTLMLLYGISGTYQPTVQASIPALATPENILPASAIINQISAIAGLLGPVIGGMLFGTFGIYPILAISIVCFFASAVMELFIYIPYKKRKNDNGIFTIIKNDFLDSTSYIKKEKPILAKIIVLLAVFNLILSALLIVGIPILIVDTLKMSNEALGFAQGVLALGGLCGGILTAVLSRRLKLSNSHNLLLLCSLLTAAMAIPLLLKLDGMVAYLIITGISFCTMALSSMFSIQMMAAIQTETPPELVGKIIALMVALAMCSQPVGQAIYGLVFDWLGDNAGFILIGAGILSTIAAIASRKVFVGLKTDV